MDIRPEDELSYRALFEVQGFRRFAVTMLLGRGAEQMWTVVMVLFVLQKFHYPALAGAVFFLGVAPGLFLSPVAGTLIDRYGRARFITFDYFVATGSLIAIAGSSLLGQLTPAILVPLVVLSGLTGMLSAAGLRSMLPLLLPRQLWDRGNGFDSAGYTVVAIAAPALGGVLVGSVGGDFALLVTAAVFAAAGLSIVGMREPRTAAAREGTPDEGRRGGPPLRPQEPDPARPGPDPPGCQRRRRDGDRRPAGAAAGTGARLAHPGGPRPRPPGSRWRDLGSALRAVQDRGAGKRL